MSRLLFLCFDSSFQVSGVQPNGQSRQNALMWGYGFNELLQLVIDKLVQACPRRRILSSVKTNQPLFHRSNAPAFVLHRNQLQPSRSLHRQTDAEKRLVRQP